MPQYNSIKPEVVRLVISSHQLAAPVITWVQAKMKPQIDKGVERILKAELENDKRFQDHKGECMMQNGLAWVGAKLYIPESQ